MAGWSVGTIDLRVRYSRGADFSGRCFYANQRFYINLGRHLKYPYRMGTHIAKGHSVGRRWFKPTYFIELTDAYQVVLFIFMHELYHLLVKRARRNRRQKETMCDRFAARHMISKFACPVFDAKGNLVPQSEWDLQDVDGFVAKAKSKIRQRQRRSAAKSPPRPTKFAVADQLLLFS